MTPAHIFFIPSVFFLGFLLGGIFASRSKGQARAIQDGGPTGQTLVIALVVFAVIFVATHVFPQFGGSKAITVATHGMPILDQRPSFSGNDVYLRLEAFGEIGRAMYQRFTYSVDVIFPLSLLVFLSLLARFVARRTTLNAVARNYFVALPFIWFGSDMLENAIVFTLLAQFPTHSVFLGGIVGFVTVAKFSFLLLAIASPAVLLVTLRNDSAFAALEKK